MACKTKCIVFTVHLCKNQKVRVTFTAFVLWRLLAVTHSHIHQKSVSDVLLELDMTEELIKIYEYLS